MVFLKIIQVKDELISRLRLNYSVWYIDELKTEEGRMKNDRRNNQTY